MNPLNQDVLVLNSDYEPINICNMKRAIGLIYLGKVDVLHSDHMEIHSCSTTMISPSVVRLRYHIKRPYPRLRLSRRSIFARDNYTCQYCGARSHELTIDHVIPRRLGGRTDWENLVCCCRKCNIKKGDKSLQQIGFHLTHPPRRPKWVPFVSLTKYVDGQRNEAWRDYLPYAGGWGAGAD
ncbi:MAG: HNH endonuclease [Armatimonadetes bacterium]|nr:HNH endonuclease [Armatimonadota bacterium]